MNPRILLPLAVLAGGILILAVLIVAKSDVKVEPPRVPPPLVRVMPVRKEAAQLRVRAQGIVKPRTESTLVSQVAGQVVSVSSDFASGGFFEPGDVLVTIDPRDYELAVARSKAQVAQAELRLAREEEEAELAREEWERVGNGQPTALTLRVPHLAEAKASQQAAAAALAQARLNLERTSVRTPYAGRVRTTNVDVGQFVGPGTPLARIYSVDYAEVRLPVPDGELAHLDLSLGGRSDPDDASGPEVLLNGAYAGREHTWSGRIVRVEGEIDNRTRMATLVARVEDPYSRGSDNPPLAVGLFVNAEVLGRVVTDVTVLPRAAFRGPDRVLVVDSEDRIRFRTVGVLRSDADSAVVHSGLADGEGVCLSPLDAAVEGMHVRTYGSDSGVAFVEEGGRK
ncbi:MAG: efflux RND transporter periplasmic adaptor subunit [Candidatus Latescibacteria bacterium]|jgi:RND family efflux transporter MFP subunit|nr:efflux RND transporter periplasmic adaptor subunit [Candidatus Latescibacterota bacterium]